MQEGQIKYLGEYCILSRKK